MSLECRTSLGYAVSWTSCNSCKDDGVVHAFAVCLTDSMGSLVVVFCLFFLGGGGGGTCFKRNLLFYCTWIFTYYVTQISMLLIDRVLYSVTGSQDLAGGQGDWRASHC